VTLASLKEKIALGTVQLGLNYGINNVTGKPDKAEAFNILTKALAENINMLDTADAYGNSIEVIGDFLKARPGTTFDIISKFIEDDKPVEEKFRKALESLNRKVIYGFMYHRFNDYRSGKSMAALLELRDAGEIKKIGVSVYGVDELKVLVEDDNIDLIQVPYNLLDGSSEKKELFKKAKSIGKEIHVRSIFLQGLLFKKPGELTGNLKGLYEPIRQFRTILDNFNINVMQACLNHALHNPLIDRVIVGVEKSAQLAENLGSLISDFPPEIVNRLDSISVKDKTLLNPAHWEP
jgi:aryl-alcohol dehydrogenase-like predicted oxidoreductase